MDGLQNVLANLNKEIAGLKNRSMKGLFEAGLKLQRVSQQELQASIISGNLRASGFTRRTGQFIRLDDNKLDRDKAYSDPSAPIDGVEVGFTALYAINVHENMNSRSPKFLESPLQRNRKALLEIIRNSAEHKT